MKNKKLEAKRLVLFLLLAFGIAWIPEIILNKTLGYENWFQGAYAILALPVIYAPMLANIITRKVTKEGWDHTLLHLNLKGHVRYYALAVLIPFAQGLLTYITMTLVYGHWDFGEMTGRISISDYIGNCLMMFAIGPLFAWNTIGEEFGWRAYMNQKMEPLLGTTGTIIAGGILWGVWHAPLTIEGHNFGKDYWGYPWLGIVTMSVWCIAMGVFLMWLTKKSGSVFPAAIMHACNNMGVGRLNTFFISGLGDPAKIEMAMKQQYICQIPYYVLAAAVAVILVLEHKRKPAASVPPQTEGASA